MRLSSKYFIFISAFIFFTLVLSTGILFLQTQHSFQEIKQSNLKLVKESLLSQYKIKGGLLATFLARDLVNPLYQYDMETVYNILAAAKEFPDVDYVYVYEPDGKIIHDGTKQLALLNRILDDPVSKKAVEAKQFLIQETVDGVDASAPIRLHQQLLGRVRVGFSTKELVKDVDTIQNLFGGVAQKTRLQSLIIIAIMLSVLLSLGFVFSAWGSRRLASPIRVLAENALQIGRGNYAVSLSTQRKDEIGDLAHSFQEMLENLKQTTVSKNYLNQVLNSMHDMLWVLSSSGEIEAVNQAVCQILQYEEKELKGQSVGKIVGEASAVLKSLDSVRVSPERYISNVDGALIKKDGEKVPVLLNAAWMETSEGKLENVVCVAWDVSELKKGERALFEEKERLATTLRSIGDGVIATDIQGRVVLMNKVAEKLTGWLLEQAQGKFLREVFDIIHEITRQPWESPVEKVLRTGLSVELSNHTLLVSRDGTERIIADSGAPIRDEESKIIGVVLVFRDVTEKKRAEEERIRASKLESVGVLASGIAHDFNNYLTAILGNISLVRSYLPPQSEKTDKLLSEAEKVSLRAKDLTQQLLTFAKGGAPILKGAPIASLLKESAQFATRGSSVQCEFFIPEDLWWVEMDSGQMTQVINNIVLNAVQAMPIGGKITVRAENTVVVPPATVPRIEKRYVKFSIQDQGIGISKEHLSKIFDPYFTTKQRGSGLGLATAYTIIRNHDGFVYVESQVGAGTTFIVYLPAMDVTFQKEIRKEKKPFTGQGKILVMDDEVMVRDLLEQMLKRLGYEPSFARDGVEAIEHYQKALAMDKPFTLVILDLTIPGGMGGKETIQKLKQINPAVKAIVSSGYSNDPIMADYKEFGFLGVVAKPYTVSDLGEAIQVILEKGQQ